MKKFIVSLMMVMVLFASSVQAAPRRGGHHFSPAPAPHHQPMPKHHSPRMHKKHKHHAEPVISFVAGLVGGVIGSYITSGTPHIYQQTNTNCFTSLSYDGRTKIKRCIETTY